MDITVLVVEDEPQIRRLVRNALEGENYRVFTVDSGKRSLIEAGTRKADLIVLDLGLPDLDGMEVLRGIRAWSHVPVLILSARGEEDDKIRALDEGADDYLAKPFDLRELLARVRSVLRRVRRGGPAPRAERPAQEAQDKDSLHFAGWRFDLLSRRLFAPDGAEVALSTGEFTLLKTFVERPHRVLSRDALIELIHHRKAGPFDRSIDVQVGRLRRKIETDADNPLLIKSVRGVGYVFTANVERG